MEDFWKRAKGFAEEAAKKSQSLSNSVKISDLVSETAQRSRELAAEASKKADLLKTAALKQADQIKSSISSSADIIAIPPQLSQLSLAATFPSSSSPEVSQSDLLKFGITDDLTDFVKGLTSTTFQSFPFQGDRIGGSHSNSDLVFFFPSILFDDTGISLFQMSRRGLRPMRRRRRRM